ncbi:MAG: hypothetical protein WBQ14_07400 [Gaiellaceae bacterium]
MAGEPAAPRRTHLSGRVWLVLACAGIVIVFLAIALPGVFDVKHGERSYEFKAPIKALAFNSKGTTHLDISASSDGRVHIRRTSSISRDSRLIEQPRFEGKTLVFHAACTGSRLGVLRRCDLHYQVRVPEQIALSLRTHFGRTTVEGTRGRIDFESDAGDFTGTSCSKIARLSVGFGRLEFHDTCVPTLLRARATAADFALTVPAGRYDVIADAHHGDGVKRPFANVIEDSASPHRIDLRISLGGSIQVTGVNR